MGAAPITVMTLVIMVGTISRPQVQSAVQSLLIDASLGGAARSLILAVSA
jgi:hypothetical protein